MNFNYLATHDEPDNEFEFGGVVSAEPDGDDFRPVFEAARELALERYPNQNVTVTEISYTH